MNEINFLDMVSGLNSSKKTEMSDGFYSCAVIGAVTHMTAYEDSEPKPKTRLILQCFDDAGNVTHLQSPSYSISLHEKSTTRKMLESFLKVSDPSLIGQKLTEIGVVKEGKFSFANFIGIQCQASVAMVPNKRDTSKVYAQVSQIYPAKAKNLHEIKTDVKIPNFFIEGAIEYKLMDGVGVFEPKDRGTPVEKERSPEVTAGSTKSFIDELNVDIDA